MKMIDAEWEQRNLGVSAVEIEVEPNDSFEDFQRALSGCDARYLVAKISVSRSDFLFGLPELGWRFVEAQESLSLQRSVYRVPKMLRRFDDRCVYRLAENRDQACAALRHFRDGSFDTDRVALDPAFGVKLAGQRYYYWAMDVFERGGEIFDCLYGGRSIGSFVFRTDSACPTVRHAVLGAMLPECQERGLGSLFFKKNMDAAFDRGAEEIRTAISSNNLTVFRLWLHFGAELTDTRYVYVRHQK